jgi:hypothetical protein
MKLYLSVIGICVAIISAANAISGAVTWYYAIIATVWCTALQFALDGLIAFIINKLPDSWFSITNPLYRVSARERKIYARLGVRVWKDSIWELGGLGGFSKRRLNEPENPEYIEKFIIECNKGVMTHKLSYPIGFLAMLTLPHLPALSIALPVAIINVLLNVLPTMALRFNTPTLGYLLARLKRAEKRTEEKATDCQAL